MAATTAIRHGLEEMLTFPAAGRPVEDVEPDTRDWLVPFGTGGYVIRYLQQPGQLLIVGIRHMREAGFDESDGP